MEDSSFPVYLEAKSNLDHLLALEEPRFFSLKTDGLLGVLRSAGLWEAAMGSTWAHAQTQVSFLVQSVSPTFIIISDVTFLPSETFRAKTMN